MAEAEPKDPMDEYDSKHGKPAPDAPVVTDADAWGEKLNPVRETPSAATNLKTVGK